MPDDDVDQWVYSIAVDTHTPQDTVSKMFEATLREITDGAKVLDYLCLLAAKRVRKDLRGKLPTTPRLPSPGVKRAALARPSR